MRRWPEFTKLSTVQAIALEAGFIAQADAKDGAVLHSPHAPSLVMTRYLPSA